MTYKEFIVKYNQYEKPASTFYHKYVPKKIAKLIAYQLYKIGFSPNLISFFSFLLLLFSISFLFFFNGLYSIIGFFLFSLLSYSLDCVDGVIARILNKSSDFGGFFDLFLDRLGQIILFVFLFIFIEEKNNSIENNLIAISFVSMFFYTITSILRSFKLKKLDGSMKNNQKSVIGKLIKFIYEFIDTGTFYFILSLSFFFDVTNFIIISYGFISLLLTLGIVFFSYINYDK